MKIEKIQPKTIKYVAESRNPCFTIPPHIKLLTNSIKIYMHVTGFHKFEVYDELMYIAEGTSGGIIITPKIPTDVKIESDCTFKFYLMADRVIDGVRLTISSEDYREAEEHNGDYVFYLNEDCKEIGNI